jgi:hypothetical protein
VQWILTALNPLRPLCDEWCLHLWEAAGSWLAGIATLLAVVVSLLLARKERIRLTVSVGHRVTITADDIGKLPEILMVTIRNVGTRDAVIDSITWQLRCGWRRRNALQLFPDFRAGEVVKSGNARHFTISLDYSDWATHFVSDIIGEWPRLTVPFLRLTVHTATGDRFSTRVEPSLKRYLIKLADQIAHPIQ